MRSQNSGECDYLEEIASFINRVLFLENGIRQLETSSMSGRRVPNYAPFVSNGLSISYRDAPVRGNEFAHQAGVNNGPVSVGNTKPISWIGMPVART